MITPEKKYRYPGTKPFEATDYALFKGRDEDIQKLYDLVLVENPVVLFSRSGLGKSSLLNAGLYTKIIKEKKAVPLFIRFGACYKDTTVSPLEKLKQVINEQGVKENFLLNKIIPQLTGAEQALWYKFKSIQINDSSKHSFVLIFDQFEELFTYPQPAIDEFKKQLAELIYVKVPQQLRDFISNKQSADADFLTDEEAELIFARLDIKILFAIRSDKLSLMNSLTDFFPTILKYCYELKPLSREQAKQAIIFPAQLTEGNFESQPFNYPETALTHILDSLTTANVTTETAENPEIETFQLQIVCKYAENLVIKNKLKEVSKNDLGDIRQIFENHYRNIIANLKNNQQLPARIMIEEKLIVDKTRVSIPQLSLLKELKDEGLSSQLIDELVNTHIIRRDQNNSVEISHDTLVEPILKYYEERRVEEEKANALKEREEELQKIKDKQEQKAKQNKKIFVVVMVALALALSLLVFAVSQMRKAGEQTAIAKRQSEIADTALLKANAQQAKADAAQASAKIANNLSEELQKIANAQEDRADSLLKVAAKQKRVADAALKKALAERKKADTAKAEVEQKIIELDNANKLAVTVNNGNAVRNRIYLSTINKAQELLDTIHSNFKLDSIFAIEVCNATNINEATNTLYAITKLITDDSDKQKFIIVKNGERYFGYLINENPQLLINDYLYKFLYSDYIDRENDIRDMQYKIKTFPHLNLLSADGVFSLYEVVK